MAVGHPKSVKFVSFPDSYCNTRDGLNEKRRSWPEQPVRFFPNPSSPMYPVQYDMTYIE